MGQRDQKQVKNTFIQDPNQQRTYKYSVTQCKNQMLIKISQYKINKKLINFILKQNNILLQLDPVR